MAVCATVRPSGHAARGATTQALQQSCCKDASRDRDRGRARRLWRPRSVPHAAAGAIARSHSGARRGGNTCRNLDALARGDGAAACALLAPGGIGRTGDFQSRVQCERELSELRELGEFPIVEIQMSSPNEGTTIIDGGPDSDTGYEHLPAKRYGDRWLLEGS